MGGGRSGRREAGPPLVQDGSEQGKAKAGSPGFSALETRWAQAPSQSLLTCLAFSMRSCPPRPWCLRWRTRMRRMTLKTPSMSLISWAQERRGRAPRTLDGALERGPTTSWVSGGFPGQPSSPGEAAASCSGVSTGRIRFLRGGWPRRAGGPYRGGQALTPSLENPCRGAAAQLFLEWGLQPSLRVASPWWPAGRKRMRTLWGEADRAGPHLPPAP